jgi:acyl-CoA thioesterase
MTIQPATIESVNNIPLLKTLDIHLVEIGETYAIMEVVVGDHHKNYFGGAHGGLIATLIDSVSFFSKPLLPSGKPCTTTNLSINYVRPAALGEKLIARSDITHLGKRTATVSVRVENSNGKLIAHGTTSLMFI